MVTKFGLSQLLGPVAYSEEEGQPFLGRGASGGRAISDETAHAIDQEVRRIIDHNYERARKILVDNIDKLHAMTKALMKYETIDAEMVKEIMEGRDPSPPSSWTGDRTPPSPPSGGLGSPAGGVIVPPPPTPSVGVTRDDTDTV